MHGVTGKEKLILKPNSSFPYQLKIMPTLGGIYAGCVTITDAETERFIWYSMELESKGQRNIQNFELTSVVRKEAFLDIPIQNPFNESLEYHIKIIGEGLSGASTFIISPRSTEIYSLKYLPLSIQSDEGSVSFTNSKAGEIFCKI
jgi:hypothetical protein